uniref:Peptidase S1 domain-containing protein n=1 Tax=Ditylum brightwellii TaxID=49249 RepID=A0A7S4SHM3_9STRA
MPRVRIAEANYKPVKHQHLTVIGMGKTEEGAITSNLLKVEVPYQLKEDCSSKFGLGPFHADSMLCAGGGETDACKGDSGGPLLYDDKEEFVQIGVVSWGRGCGSGNPAVYADVTEERAWIEKIVCRNALNSVASICETTDPPTASPSMMPSNSPPGKVTVSTSASIDISWICTIFGC